jgi:hypothetical protein
MLDGKLKKKDRGMKLKYFALVGLLAWSSAYAEDVCIADTKDAVPHAVMLATAIDAGIEGVPPDESKFFNDEFLAATRNASRRQMLEKRPYWRAYNLHSTVGLLKGTLAQLSTESIRDKIGSAAFAIAEEHSAWLEVVKYKDFDSRRTPPVLRPNVGNALG